MAPKMNTSSSSKSKSSQLGRYEELRIAHARIQAARQAKQAKEAKEPCSTRQPLPTRQAARQAKQAKEAKNHVQQDKLTQTRQATTVWSETESDSDTTLSSTATVTAKKHARKPMLGRQRTSFIWQHMKEKEVNGRRKTICKYCGANWFLDGSTSNARRHLKSKHLDKLTGCDALSSRATVTAEKHARKPMLRRSTRQAHTSRQAPTVWSESDSDTPLSSGATAAPALANFAMIKAKGNATEYVNILNNLYQANGLQAPDFTEYLP